MFNPSPTAQPLTANRSLGGFGIVELLVAATIISIVAAAGFSLFLNIQQSVHNVRVATNNVVEGRIASDRLWLDLQGDVTFFNSTLTDYPQDLPATPDDNETKLFLHRVMQGNSVYDARRAFNCRVNSATGSELHIPDSCAPVTGASQIAEFFDNLTHPTLPSIVLVESKAPCVLRSSDTTSVPGVVVLTVADEECLKQDNGSNVRMDSGVVLPRVRYSSVSGSELVSGLVFDHINVQREGAALSFGFLPEWRQTDASVYIAQAVPGPALDSAFLRIDNISDPGFMRLFNPIQKTPLALRVISPNSELRLMGPPSVDELFADNLTADNVTTFLRNLRARSNTPDNITLDITLSSDEISWKRRLIIVD